MGVPDPVTGGGTRAVSLWTPVSRVYLEKFFHVAVAVIFPLLFTLPNVNHLLPFIFYGYSPNICLLRIPLPNPE